MAKRKIIKIDEEKCNGCGLCIPNFPEGALKVIDGKVRLISDLFCDGLGACIGHCPEGAIEIEEREAEKYDERKVMENIVKQGENVVREHLEHLEEHGADEFLKEAVDYLNEIGIQKFSPNKGKNFSLFKSSAVNCGDQDLKMNIERKVVEKASDLPCGCPGTAMREVNVSEDVSEDSVELKSALRQWPVQLNLLPPHASFFNDSHLLVAADCVPFADANFHSGLLKGKSLVIGCPKLDDVNGYEEKLTEIFKGNNVKSVTVAIMEVPCCYGMYAAVENAIGASGKDIELKKVVVGVDGSLSF